MTKTNTTQRSSAPMARALTLCLLAAAAALLLPGRASAQWTTSGNTTSTNNNVGIGTATPAQMFHVHSAGTWAGTRVTTAVTGTTINDGVHFGYDDAYGAYVWNREATSLILATSNTERMRLDTAGNVGIGTASPAARLDVSTSAAAGAENFPLVVANRNTVANARTGILFQDNGLANAYGAFIRVANNGVDGGGDMEFGSVVNNAYSPRVFIRAQDGNVGIGTSSPALPLDLRSTASRVARFTGTGASHMGVQIDAAAGWNSNLVFMNGGQEKWYLGNRAGSERFSVIESTGTNEVFTITQNGKVGVGTNAPATALHVVGDITATGNIAAKYQDVAEWVPSTQKLAAGTVVVLDAGRSNHVVASGSAYDTKVAGVVSAQPGIALGEQGAGKVLVATTGRVKVRVDAADGPIKVGDLLVTSGGSGVAMKSVPVDLGGTQFHRPGTIIGKALEPLEKGTGEILVLLSLQ